MEVFRTRVGQAAEGDYYFPRDYLDERFWRKIRNGEQLLISAPRRIGKTSFLKNICSQENTDYLVKYFIIESADNSDDFFRQLYKKLLEYFSGMKRLREFVGDFIKSKKIIKIGRDGIELKEVNLDYYEEFKDLIMQVTLDKKLVFILDEFSEVLENIINIRGKDLARKFLHKNRELRHEEELTDKIQFVYSGSIGLESLAESIDATKIINDLADFTIPTLSEEKDEAVSMIDHLTIHPELSFEQEVKQYLIDRIHWLMPYYIQVILAEVETILIESDLQLVITNDIIDDAINEALKKRNYFEHWFTRLKKAFGEESYNFAITMLNALAESEKAVRKTQLFDLGVKHDIREENIRRILRILEYDGYISQGEERMYYFNSPLLKIWWKNNIMV